MAEGRFFRRYAGAGVSDERDGHMQGTGSVASTTTQPSAEPTPFTIDDDATRMVGAAASAAEAGLAGLVVTRGPDSWKERTSARSGMCFSIEPGIYLVGRFGVRI